MSSEQAKASQSALMMNKGLAENYYNVALPGLSSQIGSINQSLSEGEPGFLQQAYQGQRTGLTEGLAARGGAAQAQQMAGSKKALSGGNQFAGLHPSDVGAQLANALYGSKFQEGQANLNQQFNLMNMGMGGAGTAGNAALGASQQQLQAIGYMPNYNTTYANIVGGAAGAASLYGSLRDAGWFTSTPGAPAGSVGWGVGGPTGGAGVGAGFGGGQWGFGLGGGG